MRLFIAIDPADPLKKEIAQWITSLANAIPDPKRRLRWVKESQLHLTLKFLGETREDRLPALHETLKALADNTPPFSLRLARIGHFGGRVVWLGADTGAEQAAGLAESIQTACLATGFDRENQSYQAHLTLARSRTNAGIRLADLPPLVTQKTFGPLIVSAISLIQSTLTPQGAIYRTLERFPLKG